MNSEELVALLDSPLPGFRQYVLSPENPFGADSIHSVFAACSHFVGEQQVPESAWNVLGSLLNEIVDGADGDLDNAACTCFLENVAVPDHPLRSHLQGEALARIIHDPGSIGRRRA